MSEKQYYLKPNVVAEPLVSQWYAWPYLLSPATLAMICTNLHLPILKSFVSAPDMHVRAAGKRALLGGKFIAHGKDKLDTIKHLYERKLTEDAELIGLADDIKLLDTMVKEEANGFSVESLYAKIPDRLKGYVEIVYDLNNQPSIRFFEQLLYKSSFYQPSRQSIMLSLINDDKRSFSLSTPRLKEDDQLNIALPFSSGAYNDLFAMKTMPKRKEDIADRLQLNNDDLVTLSTLLTENPPSVTPAYTGDDVRIRYYGHATILIETKEVNILVDPAISYRYSNGVTRYDYLDLPEELHYVIITHNHQDHCLLEALMQLRHKIHHVVVPRNSGGFLQDPSLKTMFHHIGFDRIIEIAELDEIPIPSGAIVGIPFMGEHADLNIQSRIAYLIKIHGNTVCFAADSRNLENALYQHLHKIYGNIDLLFLGMECKGAPLSWLYGPLMTKTLERKMDQSRRLNGSNYLLAMDIVDTLKANEVYIYALGQEPWLNYIMSIAYDDESPPIVESNKLLEACSQKGIKAERLFGHKEMILKSR